MLVKPSMSEQAPPPTIAPIVIVTADEVAQMLGVDRKTVYAAAERGEIPHRRLGRRVLFERGTLLRWLSGESIQDRGGPAPAKKPYSRSRSRR